VTGVQTCALPISLIFNSGAQLAFILFRFRHFTCRSGVIGAADTGMQRMD
jgi:hypothetical protein